MRTTTTLATVGLLAGGLLLAGCDSSGSDTTDKPATTTASPVPTVALRDRFLQHINAANIASWGHNGPSDEELAAYPNQWCTQLAAGHSVANILSVHSGLYPSGSTWGTKINDAYQVLIIAVGDYCPTYRAAVVQQAQAGGY